MSNAQAFQDMRAIAEAAEAEVAVLRRALLDALTAFEIGGAEGSAFRRHYAEVIARAEGAEPVPPLPLGYAEAYAAGLARAAGLLDRCAARLKPLPDSEKPWQIVVIMAEACRDLGREAIAEAKEAAS